MKMDDVKTPIIVKINHLEIYETRSGGESRACASVCQNTFSPESCLTKWVLPSLTKYYQTGFRLVTFVLPNIQKFHLFL